MTAIQFPPEMEKMLAENENLEVLHVSVIFDRREPMTKKRIKMLANDVYQAAIKQLEQLKPTPARNSKKS